MTSDERPALADRRGLPNVYQPAEDSGLLASVAAATVTPDDRVVDVGTGTGYVAEAVAEAGGHVVAATDVNPHACRAASERGLPAVRTNVLDGIAADVADLVVCNPPYLPADEGVAWDDWHGAALGSEDGGSAMVGRLFADLPRVLRPDGHALVLVSDLTDRDELENHAASAGLVLTPIERDVVAGEELVVVRVAPRTADA